MSFAPLAAAALLMLSIVPPALAQNDAAAGGGGDWRFSLQGSYYYGDVDGYVQTPAGGHAATTSSRRPSLSEIGIDTTSIYDAQVVAAHRHDELYLGGQWIRMSGSDTLDSALLTHGVTFPAGTRVSSDVDFDWYRVGYRRRFALGESGEWTLWPSIGAAVLDFSYSLHSAAVSTSRSYIKPTVQFGLETEWRPRGGPFAVDLQLLGTPPVTPPLPNMFLEQLVAKYRFFDRGDVQLDAFAGVAFEQIWFEDDQTVPNRLSADFGPMVVAGINFRF